MNSKFVLYSILLCLSPMPLLAAPIFHKGFSNLNPHFGPGSSNSSVVSLGPIYTLSVGSNQQSVSLVLDITLGFTFMMCQLCQNECSTKEQVFIPSNSRSYSRNFPNTTCSDTDPCTYNFTSPYVTSVGYFSSDNFYISNASTPIGFGCGYNNTGDYGNSIGYFGLGLSNYSLIYQRNISQFWYCFTSNSSGYSQFSLGSDIQLNSTAGSSTKFINYPLVSYMINLTGITVGEMYIQIPSTGITDGSGGMVLSSTYDISYLEESVYNATKAQFMKQINFSVADGSQYGYDLCYAISSTDAMPDFPPLTLHFNGADMNGTNYFLQVPKTDLYCLMMLPNYDGISFLGTYMQLDRQMIYDIGSGMLEYRSADCNSLTVA